MNKIISQVLTLAATLALVACAPKKPGDTPAVVETTPVAVAAPPVEITAFPTVDAKVKLQINGMVSGYLAISELLINDSLPGAQAAAKKLLEMTTSFDKANFTTDQMDFYMVQSPAIRQELAAIAKGPDIESVRMHLVRLTTGMYGFVKAFHPNDRPLYYQFCPMADEGKGATWLSDKKEISNPYMGQMMPECGRNKEILKVR